MTKATASTPDLSNIPTVASYNAAVGHRAEPYQNDKRVRILVDVRSHQQMVGEALLTQGQSITVVPKSALPGIMNLVVDEAKAQQATSHFQNVEAVWKEENPDTKDLSPNSVSRSYRLLHGADMGSLNSVQILEDNLPAPMTAEERRVAAVAANVATSMGDTKSRKRG